jgi:hypothetical protein
MSTLMPLCIYPNRIWVAADHAAISSKYENRMVDQANRGRMVPIENTPKKKNLSFRTNQEIVILLVTKCQGKCR